MSYWPYYPSYNYQPYGYNIVAPYATNNYIKRNDNNNSNDNDFYINNDYNNYNNQNKASYYQTPIYDNKLKFNPAIYEIHLHEAPRTSDHQSRLQQAEMFYGYDSLYYGGNGGGGSYDQQVNYAKFNKPAYQRRNRAQYKSEYDLLVNGVQGAPTFDEQPKYGMHRSYSAPDDEFRNLNSNVYDLHTNYFYNPGYNQYLPSVQPVIYDNPYFRGYKNQAKLKKREPSLVSLRSVLSAESLQELKFKGKLQSPAKIKDPYLRYAYEQKLRELFERKRAKKNQESKTNIPVAKGVETKKNEVNTEKTNESSESNESDSDTSSEDDTVEESAAAAKKKEHTSQRNQFNPSVPQQYQFYSNFDHGNYQKQQQQQQLYRNQRKDYADPYAQNKNDRAGRNNKILQQQSKRPNGGPVFIPPDPEKLLKPTLRGPPVGFSGNPNYPPVNQKVEVDKLRQEVDVLEKQLSSLKKTYNISATTSENTTNSQSSSTDPNTATQTNQASPKVVNVTSEADNKDNTSTRTVSEAETETDNVDDDEETTDEETEADSATSVSTKEQPAGAQAKGRNQEQFANQNKYASQNLWYPYQPQFISQQPFIRYNGFDYYEFDPQAEFTKLAKSNHKFPINEYGVPYNNRNDPFGANRQHRKYNSNIVNYPNSKYNKYGDYSRNDYNQIYNPHASLIKQSDIDKKNKLDKTKKPSLDQKVDTKKVFGPSERTLQAETKKKDSTAENRPLNVSSQAANIQSSLNKPKKRYNSDKASITGSIFDVPLPADNLSEYSAFVNNVFSKALEK